MTKKSVVLRSAWIVALIVAGTAPVSAAPLVSVDNSTGIVGIPFTVQVWVTGDAGAAMAYAYISVPPGLEVLTASESVPDAICSIEEGTPLQVVAGLFQSPSLPRAPTLACSIVFRASSTGTYWLRVVRSFCRNTVSAVRFVAYPCDVDSGHVLINSR